MKSFVDLPRGAFDGIRPETDRSVTRFVAEPDCVIIFDEQGCIRNFSPEAERLFGYLAEEVQGLEAGVLMPRSDHDQPEGDIWYGIVTDERGLIGGERIVMGRRRNGGTFPMELTFHEQAVAGGRVFTGAIRDLTLIAERDRHRQELEAELLRAAHIGELNHLTSTLMNRVVRPLAEVHDDLAAGQVALHTRDRENARLMMASLVEIGERTSEVIRELHAIAKPAVADKRVENLRDVIEVASGLALAGVQKRLTLKILVTDNAGEAVIDRTQIQRVLRDMILNAVRAVGAAVRREITIATTRLGDMVEVTVADSGPGLAEAIRSRLFQARVSTRSSLFRLGLSRCGAIVEAHGGEIHAEDGVDGSIVFRLTLPRPAVESPEPGRRGTGD
jgi:two-component system sensor kinase FixL